MGAVRGTGSDVSMSSDTPFPPFRPSLVAIPELASPAGADDGIPDTRGVSGGLPGRERLGRRESLEAMPPNTDRTTSFSCARCTCTNSMSAAPTLQVAPPTIRASTLASSWVRKRRAKLEAAMVAGHNVVMVGRQVAVAPTSYAPGVSACEDMAPTAVSRLRAGDPRGTAPLVPLQQAAGSQHCSAAAEAIQYRPSTMCESKHPSSDHQNP